MDSIWISIGPILLINIIVISTLGIFLTKRKQLPSAPDLKGRHQSKMLGKTLHEYWYWLINPVGKFFVKIRFSPNILTFIGFMLSCASAYLFALGSFGYAGWLMILGATFDMFDGHVARLTNQQTRSGAYFDSVMDRFGEGVVFMGLAFYYHSHWMLIVITVAMIGSMMVSYTRARGEGVGVVCKKGPMQRPERIAYLGIGSVLHPVADVFLHKWYVAPPAVLVITAVCVIAILTVYTAIYRTVFIMNALDSADRARDEDATIPQLITKLSTRAGREDLIEQARYGYKRGEARFTSSIVFVVDGAHPETMQELMSRGQLPNLQRHIIAQGGYGNAVSVFPSTAGPASIPLVTGCFPGTCNVPGFKWFDRNVPPHKRFTLKRFRDYSGLGSFAIDFDMSREIKTVFEYSRQAVNLMGMINRGAGLRRDPGFLFTPQWSDPEYVAAKADSVERGLFDWFSQSLHRQPDFIYYYYPTIGVSGRSFGLDDKRTIEAYRRFDQYVGDVVELLKTHGMYDNSALLMVSNYGYSPIREKFDLNNILDKCFNDVWKAETATAREWVAAEAMQLVSGNAMSHIYLRRDRAWSQPQLMDDLVDSDIVKSLLDSPAVDLVLGRMNDGGVMIKSAEGSAIVRENGVINYQVLDKDPLSLGDVPSRMDSARALQVTQNSQYPDVLQQTTQIFRSSRSGDLVVSAKSGFSFAKNETHEDKVTHGSLRREHIKVPCALNFALNDDSALRTVDLFPTVLESVGISTDSKMDGKSLL